MAGQQSDFTAANHLDKSQSALRNFTFPSKKFQVICSNTYANACSVLGFSIMIYGCRLPARNIYGDHFGARTDKPDLPTTATIIISCSSFAI
jgi:hypothetical protein